MLSKFKIQQLNNDTVVVTFQVPAKNEKGQYDGKQFKDVSILLPKELQALEALIADKGFYQPDYAPTVIYHPSDINHLHPFAISYDANLPTEKQGK